LAGGLTPILTSRRTCCLGAPTALLWRFRELPEDPELMSVAASLFFSLELLGCGLFFVVAFSALLPFCCYHFKFCPFAWSLPPLFLFVVGPFSSKAAACVLFLDEALPPLF